MSLKSQVKLPKLDASLIRPCYSYGEEFDECVTLKGRFHQYFIYGDTFDCSQWQKDYENCLLCKNSKNQSACESVIASEQNRRDARLKGHYENDVWKRRKYPPSNWNTPLPDYMREGNKSA